MNLKLLQMNIRRWVGSHLMAALALTLNVVSASAEPSLTIIGPVETVFQWKTQRCSYDNIPDSPARALRLDDGRVALFASHYNNIPFSGPNFDHLTPVCGAQTVGHGLPDPNAFDDRVWLQSVAKLPNGSLLALGSHEYFGRRHPGYCQLPRIPCWYSSIVSFEADPGSLTFRAQPLPRRVVAVSPHSFDGSLPRRSGFFSASNIITDGRFVFVFVYSEGIEGQPRGMCLLRSTRDAMSVGWKALARGDFTRDLGLIPNIAQAPQGARQQVCDVVGQGILRGNVRSVVRLGRNGPWIALFVQDNTPTNPDGSKAAGVYYSTSQDLVHWQASKLLYEMSPFHGQDEARIYYQYPSLIDHGSESDQFDIIGSSAYLYLTRYNFWPDRRDGGNRDLIRIRVNVVGE